MARQDEPCEVGEQVEVSWTPITMFPIEDKSENKETKFIAEVIKVRSDGDRTGIIAAIEIKEMLDTPDGPEHFKVGDRHQHPESTKFKDFTFKKINE
ncbi:hypothetical protein VB638_16415 [Dolichospermum sp. UHCC 0684]|uniref:hypothetical protein n=1 Tax=unclassified Dolichospermum TaxID=2622029 RepID=UPI001447B568|nr:MULTISPECIES: hypothetical protein [unclassified Dolichospermum]MEA5531130.1 hypothetical protein [Dolichospermum sp. UHCC 0684]MTJ36982.1 hypothetical protein [Dolichospermum sp. UHCC 0260]